MKLVIAEKPSVAKTIAVVIGAGKQNDGYLSGNGYAVAWCFGHLAEFAQPESYNERYAKWRYEDLPIIPDTWQYAVGEDKRKQFEIVTGLMKNDSVTEIINACDAGREGELIFRTVYQLAGCTKPIKRLWISSMEDTAVKRGFDNLRPGSEYDCLYYAALCRSKADWLVGINATRLFSVLYHRTLNVGRVVSPTLSMIVQREAEIKAFKSEPFYKVVLDFNEFKAESERFENEDEANAVAKMCNRSSAVIQAVEKNEKRENAPALYDLTTLQRAANRLLGYTAQQTLDYLQNLYEKKLCTYPRTDSKFLTEDMKASVNEMTGIAAKILGTEAPNNINSNNVCDNAKVTDHHAIILTKSAKQADVKSLIAGEREILKLIARRMLCAVSEAYLYTETTVDILCAGTRFKAKGKTVSSMGWKLYLSSNDKDEILPDLYEGQLLNAEYVTVTEGKTTPPKHYTEDTILSAMEKAGEKEMPENAERKGIGTPATRAAMIEKLVSVGFITRVKGHKTVNLLPDNVGTSLITILPEELQSPLLTAEWEHQLLSVEKGEMKPEDFLSGIKKMVSDTVHDYKVIDGAEILFPSERTVVGKCPRCGSNVTESKKGYFCEKNSCKFALWRDNRFLTSKRINLSQKIAQELLKNKKAYVSGIYSEQTGKRYNAFILMSDDGVRTNFSLEFENKNLQKEES